MTAAKDFVQYKNEVMHLYSIYDNNITTLIGKEFELLKKPIEQLESMLPTEVTEDIKNFLKSNVSKLGLSALRIAGSASEIRTKVSEVLD